MTAKQKTQWKAYGIWHGVNPIWLSLNRRDAVAERTNLESDLPDDKFVIHPITISLATKPRGKRG